MMAAAKEVSEGKEIYSARGGGGKQIEKPAAEKSQLYETPAADVGTDQTQHDVRDATEAAPARNLSRQPSGNEAEQKPRDEAVRFEPDANRLLCKHVCSEHRASRRNKNCI